MSSSDEIATSGTAFFARFDAQFQQKIMQAMLTDRDWAGQMIEVMSPSYFDVKYLSYLAEQYFTHYKQHRTFPSLSLIATMVREDLREGNAQILQSQIVDYLHRLKFNPETGDLPHVKEMALSFCRKQAMKEALNQAVDLVEDTENQHGAQARVVALESEGSELLLSEVWGRERLPAE